MSGLEGVLEILERRFGRLANWSGGFARRQPVRYALVATAVSSASVFFAAHFSELSQGSALQLMGLCGATAFVAVIGAVPPKGVLRRRRSADVTDPYLKTLISAIDDGVMMFDANLKLVMSNPLVDGLFPEIAGRRSLKLDLRDCVRIIAAYGGRTEKGLTGREFVDEVYQFLARGSGAEIYRLRGTTWIRLATRLADDGSRVVIVSDLTELMQRELKLKESEERFERLAERLPGTVFQRHESANGTFRFTYWSAGVRDVTGLEPDQLTGGLDGFLSCVHPDDRNDVRQRFADGDRTQMAWQAEFRVVHPVEGVRWVSIALRSRLNAIGRGVFEGVIQDMTERKRVELEILDARERAERANDAKSQFLANMSHELRTPLNAVIGFSEIMIDGTFGEVQPPKYGEYVRDIHYSAVHLLELISDILDLSRYETGNMELREEEVDLSVLLKDCQLFFTERAARSGLRFDVRMPVGEVHVRVDRLRLRQILLNLVSNAIKFTPRGGQIRVATVILRHGLSIIVSDSGVGMTDAEIHRAFEPFGQVDAHLATNEEGTGLGLPISRILAEKHGGTLVLESKPGEGTKAILRLPAARICNGPDIDTLAGRIA